MKSDISTILMCVILLSIDVTVHGKIHSRLLESQQLFGKTFKTSELGRLTRLARHRRSSDSNDSKGKEPAVTSQTLDDPSHNEAIVHWSGNNSDVIFILTRQHNIYNGSVNDSRLWRSDDYGTQFKDVTKDITQTGVLTYYQISPSDKDTLLFVDRANKMIYRTTDEGKTYAGAKVDFMPDKLYFHPTEKNTVLGYDIVARTLYTSSDLFQSYSPLQQNVNPRYFWAVDGIDKNSTYVHMEVKDPKTGNYMYKRINAKNVSDVMVATDVGSIDVDSLLVQNEYIFLQKSTPFTSYLYVSHNRGPFKKAYFPKSRHAQDFTIVTADEHQVFIAANHHEGMVSLYLSDTTGQFYTTSLKAVVSLKRMEGGFIADLYEARGMKGTYIVNQHTDSNPRTLVTFDQGGHWHPIQPPEKDLDGKPYNCSVKTNPKCGLHLHLHFGSERYRVPYILSDNHAPGFILAHGVVGTGLIPTNTGTSLFMSTDGGFTWKPVFRPGTQYIVKMLDHGAAMVAMPIKDGALTKSIMYSSTEGESWDTYSLKTKESFHVEGVINEPGINTLVVSVFGHDNTSQGWTIVKMNFSTVLTRECNNDDFQFWYPSDKIAGIGCLLGQKMKYERKKTESQCYIKRDYDRPVNTTICQCAPEDYECDYGYEEDPKNSGACLKASWFDDTEPLVDCPIGQKYNKSKGFRRVASDVCSDTESGSTKYGPVEKDCPLVQPRDVYLTTKTGQTVVSTGETVNFIFNQDRGTKSVTKYSWQFGEKNETLTIKGYDKGGSRNYTYHSRGIYTVKVTAQNDKGSISASLSILVEDHIRDVTVLTPHGAMINREVTFEAVSQDLGRSSHVHFIWTFGDEGPNDLPILTWNNTVHHVFKKPGNYTVTLETINNVGSVFRKMDAVVYGTLTTIQMDFNDLADRINTQTELWRELFGTALKEAILDNLDADRDAPFDPARLEVVILPGIPTLADVSVLPVTQKSTNDPSIQQVTNKIMSLVKPKKIVFQLGEEDFRVSQKIVVIGATIVKDKTPSQPPVPSNNTAIYVAIPLIMIAIVITVLIVIYYRKKYERMNRYSLLEARSGEPDSLLDDTDDDDPPLDPNPDPREERLAFSDDDMDDPLSAHLRLGTGRGGNTVHC